MTHLREAFLNDAIAQSDLCHFQVYFTRDFNFTEEVLSSHSGAVLK